MTNREFLLEKYSAIHEYDSYLREEVTKEILRMQDLKISLPQDFQKKLSLFQKTLEHVHAFFKKHEKRLQEKSPFSFKQELFILVDLFDFYEELRYYKTLLFDVEVEKFAFSELQSKYRSVFQLFYPPISVLDNLLESGVLKEERRVYTSEKMLEKRFELLKELEYKEGE